MSQFCNLVLPQVLDQSLTSAQATGIIAQCNELIYEDDYGCDECGGGGWWGNNGWGNNWGGGPFFYGKGRGQVGAQRQVGGQQMKGMQRQVGAQQMRGMKGMQRPVQGGYGKKRSFGATSGKVIL